jgi:hypothetical protein
VTAWNRRASYAAHMPAVMAATEPEVLARPLPMVEAVEERSCWTCGYNSEPHNRCMSPDVVSPAIDNYVFESGAWMAENNKMPTDRTLKCPGWSPKEPT